VERGRVGDIARAKLIYQSEVNGAHMNDVFAWLKANGKEVDGAGGIGGTTSIKW
jgi:glutathione peroxidase